jgi:hypothetical protein
MAPFMLFDKIITLTVRKNLAQLLLLGSLGN